MKFSSFLLLFFFSSICNSQTYEFLNDVFDEMTNKSDTIYLNNNYIIINNDDFVKKVFNYDFFQNNWNLNNDKKIVEKYLFFDNFDITHLRLTALNVTDSIAINIEKLNSQYILSKNELPKFINYKNLKGVWNISKPIFNCSKDWAVFYSYVDFPVDVGSSGYLYIYKKINNKWTFYHKITVWIS